MDLDQRAAVVDVHQLRADLDFDLLLRRAERGRHWVERVLAGDVVVDVDCRRAPVRQLVRFPVPRGEQYTPRRGRRRSQWHSRRHAERCRSG